MAGLCCHFERFSSGRSLHLRLSLPKDKAELLGISARSRTLMSLSGCIADCCPSSSACNDTAVLGRCSVIPQGFAIPKKGDSHQTTFLLDAYQKRFMMPEGVCELLEPLHQICGLSSICGAIELVCSQRKIRSWRLYHGGLWPEGRHCQHDSPQRELESLGVEAGRQWQGGCFGPRAWYRRCELREIL